MTRLYLFILIISLAACSTMPNQIESTAGPPVQPQATAVAPAVATSTPTTQPTIQPTTQPTTQPTPPPELLQASLPPLPALDNAVGGEGGVADPLPAVEYVLNAALPDQPAAASVLLAPYNPNFTPDWIAEIAQRFGVEGELYVELIPGFPDNYWLEPEHGALPRLYLIAGGDQSISISSEIYYYNTTALDPIIAPMPYERAVPIAEAFLRQRDLLDFPYHVALPGGNSLGVEFQRRVGGHRLLLPEFDAGVSTAGRVYGLQYRPLDNLQHVNEYRLRPPAAAWQDVLDGLAPGRGYYTLYAVPTAEFTAGAIEVDVWRPAYQAGQPFDIYSFISAYQPVSGDGPPRVLAGPFVLQAAEEELRAMAGYSRDVVHLWGTLRQDEEEEWLLDVAGWEPFGLQVTGRKSGVIESTNGQTLFYDDVHGETYLLVDAPAGLAAGDSVEVEGWFTEAEAGSRSAYHWLAIWRYRDTAIDPTPTVPPTAPPIGQIVIDAVELVYAPSFHPFVATLDGGPEQEFRLFQPAWLFAGYTDTGRLIEVIVPAIVN